jgi:beta-lactam-binding protein with PASTA domain
MKAFGPGILLASLSLLVLASGCVQAKPHRVPDLRGDRLDFAEATLKARGLSYEIFGGGKLGVIDEENWWVCAQKPSPGRWVEKVNLVVAKSCGDIATIPNVVGLNLHDARKELEASRVDVDVETYDDETVAVERNWRVCEQYDTSHDGERSVELIVDRYR